MRILTNSNFDDLIILLYREVLTIDDNGFNGLPAVARQPGGPVTIY